MEKICDYKDCTGCGVCAAVCPKHCISFIIGDLGHIYPKIDVNKCIDCKRCERECVAINDQPKIRPRIAYAGIIKNEYDCKTTTSGGAAQAISQYCIQNGGVVYGCASLPGGVIEHIRVEDLQSLELLKGSKYVQSTILKIVPQLIADVRSGRKVVFIGTPCQCAAVKLLFKENPDSLTVVELICHGVPSKRFLYDYLNKQGVNTNDIDRMWFRTEKGFQILCAKKAGDSYSPIYESIPLWSRGCHDLYYNTFFYGYSYRPSCYHCKFARPERIGDITIGDFWGLGRDIPADDIPDHSGGISVILPCTDKGLAMVNAVGALMDLYERPVEEAIAGNHQLQHPTVRGLDVYLFYHLSKVAGLRLAFDISFFLRRLGGRIKRIIHPERH